MNKYSEAFEADVQNRTYKRLLGGGADGWDARGQAQLEFMKAMGLAPSHRLLEIGCGPLRAGRYFIEYLDAGNYAGFDFNASFLTVAMEIISDPEFAHKKPRIDFVNDFDVGNRFSGADFGLAFSVLNHCDSAERERFFASVAAAFRPGASVFVTHARWFEHHPFREGRFELRRRIDNRDGSWFDAAWPPEERGTVFPILEFAIL
jgi:SAM-dependent methyltransferase